MRTRSRSGVTSGRSGAVACAAVLDVPRLQGDALRAGGVDGQLERGRAPARVASGALCDGEPTSSGRPPELAAHARSRAQSRRRPAVRERSPSSATAEPSDLEVRVSVVAPIRVTKPSSTRASTLSAVPCLKRWISSMKRIVRRPFRRGGRGPAGTPPRTSSTRAETATAPRNPRRCASGRSGRSSSFRPRRAVEDDDGCGPPRSPSAARSRPEDVRLADESSRSADARAFVRAAVSACRFSAASAKRSHSSTSMLPAWRGMPSETTSEPILEGRALDYERYLNTEDCSPCTKAPTEWVHRDELLFQDAPVVGALA